MLLLRGKRFIHIMIQTHKHGERQGKGKKYQNQKDRAAKTVTRKKEKIYSKIPPSSPSYPKSFPPIPYPLYKQVLFLTNTDRRLPHEPSPIQSNRFDFTQFQLTPPPFARGKRKNNNKRQRNQWHNNDLPDIQLASPTYRHRNP